MEFAEERLKAVMGGQLWLPALINFGGKCLCVLAFYHVCVCNIDVMNDGNVEMHSFHL